ncbi:thiaminase II [Roseibium litorale]|uniref:Aminopyrimidine aminohydrolase n=1 Tax=Roseibium litorale TaxID=2803841 RepID=A0ABR9CTF9_9HYPH|nr:thiaminase II [Roseibium litorale]MBD8894167.1 thiaminase II [Roseibium litorale]
MPSFFERLRADSIAVWQDYICHEFVNRLSDGSLPEEAFRTYLAQDYLFLIQFSRAHALAVYKAGNLSDMHEGLAGLKAIMDTEMDLHVGLCAGWGLSKSDLEALPEASQTIAYTRFVLETGLRGDLLDLQVALAPCILGYAEIGRLNEEAQPQGPTSSAYRNWLDEYSGKAYQSVAQAFSDWMDRTAERYLTEARYPSLLKTFSQASTLETDFWQMGLNAAQ